MSDIHVLENNGANGWRVVLHIPIPNTNNDASINYRTALVNSGLGGSSILSEGTGPGQITAAELASITSGALYEVVQIVLLETGGVSAPNRRSMIRSEYIRAKDAAEALIQQKLRYFGYTESET